MSTTDEPPGRPISLGITGIGNRGQSLVETLLALDDVEIAAICDVQQRRLDAVEKTVVDADRPAPATYADHDEMLAREDLDGAIIATSWRHHIPMAIRAMEAGVWTAMDVGPADSVEECWDLVDTAERTGQHCMLLENCCFRREPMAVLNMTRAGLFGDLVHCECGYCHDLRPRLNSMAGTSRTETSFELQPDRYYRSIQHERRNGDLYPTHGVGPMAKCLNVNRGNRFLSLTATASKPRGLRDWAARNLPDDHQAHDIDWNHGDIVTTVVTCANGETIVVTHDVTLPRPDNSKRYAVRGTRGMWQDELDGIYVDDRSPDHEWESFEPYCEEFEHPLWAAYREAGIQRGHGGSDYLTLLSFTQSIARDVRPPIDVYDAAAWMALAPLSEQSIASGNESVAVPDFTNGNWLVDEPIFGRTDHDDADRLDFATLL